MIRQNLAEGENREILKCWETTKQANTVSLLELWDFSINESFALKEKYSNFSGSYYRIDIKFQILLKREVY